MKKWITVLLLILLLLPGTASAKTYTFSDPQYQWVEYVCEDFVGELPEYAQEAFSDVLLEDDVIICGTMVRLFDENAFVHGSGILAVKRGDKQLLLGAVHMRKDKWRSAIESDSFLPENQVYSMTAVPDYSKNGNLRSVYECIRIGNEKIYLDCRDGGCIYLTAYIREETDGTRTAAAYRGGYVDWGKWVNRKMVVTHGSGPLPTRACAWTWDSLPKNHEESGNWTAANPFETAGDEGYLSGVNLREKPTGKSKSWGIYRAKVQVLDQQPGEKDPWMKVRVGNLTGWASGRYLYMEQSEDPYALAEYQTSVKKVGRAKKTIQLLDRPDGNVIMELEEGKLVHAIIENEGWLHVVVPREELTWRTDWDGTYGFVQAEDMFVGISKADAMWRN